MAMHASECTTVSGGDELPTKLSSLQLPRTRQARTANSPPWFLCKEHGLERCVHVACLAQIQQAGWPVSVHANKGKRTVFLINNFNQQNTAKEFID